MNIRFFNTFDTSAPFFRGAVPHLAAAGHEVELYLANRSYRPGSRFTAGRTSDPRVVQLPTLAPSRPRRSRLAAIHATYAFSAALRSLFAGGTELNFFLTQPPLFFTWGWVLRRLRRQRYCVLVMDLYPWVAIEAGVVEPRAPVSEAAKRIAREGLRGAEAVVVIGRCMAEKVAAVGVPESRIRIITLWADPRVVEPVAPETNGLRRELGLRNELVVLYSGNLGVSHYFDDLLAVAEGFQRDGEDHVVFVFVGGGSRMVEVERFVEERSLENVRTLEFQPYERLNESLSLGDVHFVSLREGFEGLVVPSKAYGALAAGRPIIYQGRPRGEIARIIEEHEVGIVVPQGSPDALRSAISRVLGDATWRREAGERARRVATGPCSPSASLEKLDELLESLRRESPVRRRPARPGQRG